MRIIHILHASPLVLLLSLIAAGGCGSSVVGGSGGTGTGASGTGASGTAFDACTGPGQCELVGNSCCGPCGEPELSNLSAVNQDQADAFFKSVCPEPVPCPACASGPNPNLFAYCDGGHCKGADTRTDPVGACNSDADCRLRFGTGCCEPCSAADGTGLTAVNVSSNLGALVCPPNIDCPGCIPAYPPGAMALCMNGHCAVAFLNGGG